MSDTLGSAHFRHPPAIPDLLDWFVRLETKTAAAKALALYKEWMERNKPLVLQTGAHLPLAEGQT